MHGMAISRYRFSSPRASAGTRIVIDLFGPLIDISVLTFLRDLPDARSAALSEIVAELGRREPDAGWTEAKVITKLVSALRTWDYYGGLLNLPAIESLGAALERGTEVRILTTAPHDRLVDVAWTAVASAFSRNGIVPSRVPLRLKKIQRGDGWKRELSRLRSSPKYTYVIHDSHPSDVISRIPAPARARSLHDEWFGSPDSALLDRLIRDALDRETRFAPLAWLASRSTLRLRHYKAVGAYLIHDESLRRKIREQARQVARRARHANTPGKEVLGPATVVLGGPSGAGKSFFAKQFIGQFGRQVVTKGDDTELAVWDLSGVWNLQESLAEHIHDIAARKSAFALLDEVDTIIDGRVAFRFLMRPMGGEIPLASGRGSGVPLRLKVWFMAGSVGGDRPSWIDQLAKTDRKVIDWSNRVFEWIELPRVESFQAVLQAASAFLAKRREAPVSRAVLVYFGLASWRDGRHLKATVDAVAAAAPTGRIQSEALVRTIRHLPSEARLFAAIRKRAKGDILLTR